MAISPQDAALIDSFLAGTLSEAEQALFELRKKDAAFEQELEFRRSLKAASMTIGRERLKSRFEAIESKIGNSPARSGMLLRWAVAAGLALCVVAYFLVCTETPSTDSLYAAYFVPAPNLVAPLSKGTAATTDTFTTAFQYYELGQYDEAAKLFTSLSGQDPAVDFYYGLTAMQLGQWDLAETMVNTIAADAQHPYQQQAQWYLALLYLKNEEITQCRDALNSVISDTGHPFRNEAQELLEQL